MKNYKKHIDDFFREKLGRYRETPPDDVWDGLQGKLDTLKPYVPTSPFRWVWHFGMVSIIAVLSVSLTRKFINKPATNSKTEVVATTTRVAPASEQALSAPASEQPSAQQDALASNNQVAGANASMDAQHAQPGSTVATAATANKQVATTGNDQHIAGNTKTTIVRESHANGTKSAKLKDNPAQQLAYAATTGSRSTNSRQYNATGNKKENSSQKKLKEFFNGNSSIAQLSATMNNAADNNTGESTELPVEAAAVAANSGLAAVPVINNTVKKVVAPEIKKPVVTPKVAEKKADKPTIKRFDFGVKAGYEQGPSSPSATKWVVAPYLQYHVAPKVSLMLQPGIKYATIDQRNVGRAQTYYSVNQDGKVVQNGPTVIDSIKVRSTNVDTYYHTNYRYTQSHDSISKSKTYGGSYVEFELPVLLNYNISKQLSVYGGVNLIFSKRIVVNENTYVHTGIQRTKDSTVYGTGTPADLTAPTMSGFTYTGNSYSEYQNPGIYPMKTENMLRVGYMIGMSYEYSNRWLFDALIQHSPLKPDVKDGYNLNSSLSSPYFRLSVGYKLTK